MHADNQPNDVHEDNAVTVGHQQQRARVEVTAAQAATRSGSGWRRKTVS
jgi:hypothetical protein